MTSEHTTSPTGRLHRRTATALGALTLAATAACGSNAPSATDPGTTAPPTTTTLASPVTSPAPGPVTSPAPRTDAAAVVAARPTDARDELVDVEGDRIHLRCHGAGASTVILVAGFGDGSDVWAAIEPALAARTRVCAYDHPGTGTSAAPSTTQTFASQAEQLGTLLATRGEPGPYVVVGHSFGGAAAAAFASDRADTVEALVLVDASPTGWATSLCAIADDGTGAATFIRGMCDSWADPTANPQHLDVFAAFDELAGMTSLGDLPVTVLTADHRELPADTSAAERARLEQTWDDGQAWWAALSTDARLVTVAGSGHYVQLDRPSLVVDEIARLLP